MDETPAPSPLRVSLAASFVPTRSLTPTRSALLVLTMLVLVGALVANALVSIRSVAVLSRSFANVERPANVQRTLTLLLSTLQDAETGQRGYLLTGDPSYLDPYDDARTRSDSLLGELDSLVAWNPLQVGRMPALRADVGGELAYLERLIGLYDAEGQAAALRVLRDGEGKRRMDRIRERVDAMLDEALRVRTMYGERSREARRRARLSIGVTNGVLALVLLGLGLATRWTLRARERDAQAQRETNASLSSALAAREAALARVHAMQGQLVQQEKMASMGRLTAGVAHEIKNPLNFVNNFAQLSTELVDELAEAVAEGRADEAHQLLGDLRQNADKILAHGRRADGIVQAMLVHARGVKGERASAALAPLLDAAVEQAVGPEGAGDVRIVRTDAGALPEIPVVASAIVRVVTNLVQNALHAVRERAGAGDAGYAPQIRVASRAGRDRLGREVALVTVEDNGAGIPDELLPRIFEPFFTTKGPGAGTGLGLSLSHDIAVGHGGSLLAGTAPGGGALFTLTLPVELADADLPADSSTEATTDEAATDEAATG